MVRNDNQGKKITSLKRPLWRRLLDILFVHLLFSLFLCLYAPTSGSRRQAGRLKVCVCICVYVRRMRAYTLGPFGQETVGSWSPLCLLNPGGNGNIEGFGKRWKFLAAFWTWMSWSCWCILTAGSMEYALLLSARGHVEERQSWVQSGGVGHVFGFKRVSRNNQTLWSPAAYLAQELQAVP